jgi:uncharacterized protein (TIGR02594 family)
MEITAFDLAQRFVGIKETAGAASNPHVLAMLRLDQSWPSGDDVPWCSAFANYVAWLLRLPRSKSLAARSWLDIGQAVLPREAQLGYDVVVLSRGLSPTAGHVGFFAGWDGTNVRVLGGNQGDAVSIATFPTATILGIRRLV